MISIVTVNFNSYDFLQILIESLEIYSSAQYELIVVDNSSVQRQINRENVRQFFQKRNIGHGEGLNWGLGMATRTPHTLVLDVDSHILCRGWEKLMISELGDHDVLAGKGVPEKPLRPSFMFMKRPFGMIYDWRATEGYKGHRVTPEGFDVGIQAYHKMLADGVKVKLVNSQKNHYGTLNGEEWVAKGTPVVYHHWHGSHLVERQVDFPNDDLIEDKKKLFSKIPWKQL